MADVKDTTIQEGKIRFFSEPTRPQRSRPHLSRSGTVAYDKVRSDKDPATWLLLDYDSPTSNKLTLTKTGEGANSIEELAAELSDDKASFGYVRVKYQNDEQSFREKFVLVIFIGSNG
jgi:hypothetical protein